MSYSRVRPLKNDISFNQSHYDDVDAALSAAATATTSLTASLSAAASSGASTVTILTQPSWVRAGQRVIIDPYTSICEAAIIQSVSGSTVTLTATLANNHANGTAVFAPSSGLMNVEWWGARGDGTSGQEVPINAALVAARVLGSGSINGGIYLPRGNYSTADQITHGSGIVIVGDGPLATQISPATDFGAGKYAIVCSDRSTGNVRYRDFQINRSVSITPGVVSTNMHGLADTSSCRYERIRIRGMNAGIEIRGNHGHFKDLDIGNCYDGFYHADGTVYGIGNNAFTNMNCSGNARSGWAVAGGNNIAQSIFTNVEVVNSPFGFFKEAYTSHGFMNNTIIDQCNCENVGNAFVYDVNSAGSSAFNSNIIRSGSINIDLSHNWSAYNVQAFRFDSVSLARIDVDDTLVGIAHFNAPFITAHDISQLHIHGATSSFWATLASNSIQFAVVAADFDMSNSTWEGGDGTGVLLYTGSTVAAGGLVKPNGVKVAAITTTTTDVPFGYATMAGASGDVIGIQQAGRINVLCTGTVAANSYVKPSTGTGGSVMAATSKQDGNVCGIAVSGGTNTTIAVAALV